MDLHCCWLIEAWRPSRERYLRAWQDAGFHIVLWHRGQLLAPPVPGVELRLASEIVTGSRIERAFNYEARYRCHASCADLFRYQVLCARGGAYADIDVLPTLTPADLAGAPVPQFGHTSTSRFEIRFIYAITPGHPLLQELRDMAAYAEERFIRQGGYDNDALRYSQIVERTGPIMAARLVSRWAHARGRSLIHFQRDATYDATHENTTEHHNCYGAFPPPPGYRPPPPPGVSAVATPQPPTKPTDAE